MQTNPRDEREIRNEMVLMPGDYDFEVIKGVDTVSQKGNDMIELTLRVFPHDGGNARVLKDWLVPGSTMGDLKINRFCHCVGLQKEYFEGELTGVSCEGAAGTLRLTVSASEQYGDQNRVKDYLIPEPVNQDDSSGRMPDDDPEPPRGVPAAQTKAANRKAKAEQPVEDSEIPF